MAALGNLERDGRRRPGPAHDRHDGAACADMEAGAPVAATEILAENRQLVAENGRLADELVVLWAVAARAKM